MDRILIVDDEDEMTGALTQALSENGFQCRSAGSGRAALGMVQDADLLIVDIMMPSMSGTALVEKLRQSGSSIPVIFLTAKDAPGDVASGLDLGADDYIVKPFRLTELLARVRANLRRARLGVDELAWHDIRMDARRRTVHRGGWEIFFSATEFALMEVFLRNPGVVLDKPRLLGEVWHDDGIRSENIVETYITYIRRKTEVKGFARVIQTVRGRGYVLALAQD